MRSTGRLVLFVTLWLGVAPAQAAPPTVEPTAVRPNALPPPSGVLPSTQQVRPQQPPNSSQLSDLFGLHATVPKAVGLLLGALQLLIILGAIMLSLLAPGETSEPPPDERPR